MMASKNILLVGIGVGLLASGVVIGRFSVPGGPQDGDRRPAPGERPGYRVPTARESVAARESGQVKGTLGGASRKVFEVFNAPDGNQAILGLYEALRGMTGAKIGEMLLEVDALPNHARRREIRERLVDYLTMTDPVKALEVRDSLPGQNILAKAFQQLGRNGLAAAMVQIEQLEDAGDRRDALVQAFVGASEIDPAGAFAALSTTPGVGASHYHEVFDNWAETDPAAAAAAALTVESAAERRSALKIVGQEWAEQDPQGALTWLETAALTSFERESIRKSAINGFARRDPVAAMELLATLDPAMRSRMLPDTVQQLARKYPEAAIEWYRNEPAGYAKSKAAEDALHHMASKAPAETIALAREFPEIKEQALAGAFGTLARNDLPGALEMLKDWEADPQYANLLQNVASSYAREDVTGALEWAMKLPEEHKGNVLSSVVSNMAGEDPQLAIHYLDQLAAPEYASYHDNAVQNIASNWARKDPVAAADWLQDIPDSRSKNNAVRQVADQWARADPVSASEWIAGLPAGQGRDMAAQSLINRIRKDDPESAVAWSESLSNESARNNALQNVYQEWMQHDRDRALESLADSPLPDQWKRNLVPELNAAPQNIEEGGLQFVPEVQGIDAVRDSIELRR